MLATLWIGLALGLWRAIPAEPLSDWLVVASMAACSLGAGLGMVSGRPGLGMLLTTALLWILLFAPAIFRL